MIKYIIKFKYILSIFIIFFILLIFFIFSNINSKAIDNSIQVNLESSYSYNSNLGSFLISLKWDSPKSYQLNNEYISDYGYVILEQELKSESMSADGEEKVAEDIFPPEEVNSFNSGGIAVEQKKILGTLKRKYKYTLIIYDKGIGSDYDMVNQSTMSNFIVAKPSTTVEINPLMNLCTGS